MPSDRRPSSWLILALIVGCADDAPFGDAGLPIQRPADAAAETMSAEADAQGGPVRDPLNASVDASATDGAVALEDGREADTAVDASFNAGEVDAGGSPGDAGAEPGDRDAGSPPQQDAGPEPGEFDAGMAFDGGHEEPPEDGGSEPGEADAAVDAGEYDAGDPGPITFTQVYALFRLKCRGCHVTGRSFDLDMSSQPSAYDALVGGSNKGAAQYVACKNKGYFLVIPGAPDNSLLVQKLEDRQPCGSQMPPAQPLSAAERRMVRSWIAAGALNN